MSSRLPADTEEYVNWMFLDLSRAMAPNQICDCGDSGDGNGRRGILKLSEPSIATGEYAKPAAFSWSMTMALYGFCDGGDGGGGGGEGEGRCGLSTFSKTRAATGP